ncbi:MAG TPA: chemotaxis protein CheA [Oceanipulchritudo sp.]|nr:chemotaxis protein CheA [Oceanipulchritudo sp.]
MIPQESISELERLIESLSVEMTLIEVGKDEGLVPAYSLLGELVEVVQGHDVEASDRCTTVLETLGGILDRGGYFDEAAVAQFTRFMDQARCLLRYYRMGEPLSWKALEEQWTDESEDLSGDEAPSAPSMDAGPEAKSASVSSPEDTLMVLDLEESVDVLEEFYQEAIEHLENIEAALLELENDPKDVEAISSVFRSFHTIKGVAGFLDLKPIRVLAHEVETLLDLVRSDKLDLDEDVVSLVLESRDRLQLLMGQVQAGLQELVQPAEIIQVSDLIERTVLLMGGAATAPAPATAEAEGFPPEAAAADLSFDEEEDVVPVGPLVGEKPTPSEGAVGSKAATASESPAKSKEKASATSIRMNTEKLDGIIDAVGELVIVESQLRDSILSSGTTSSRIERNLAQLGRITRELQRSGLSLRMVSLKQIFQKMQRLSRDLANKSGKKVAFRVEGEDTEMDRTVVEKIGDPLVHMIRNSMDHGIEPPEERIESGKPEFGQVTLRAYYQGDTIVLELSDDGRGINAERVLKKAVERGLVQEGKQYSREEIINFLFLPGFSTAEKVSDISGRGVGMDVVRTNVQKLRGRIELTSEEGRGSVVRIALPLTMAIIDGLLIRVGTDRYILPVMSVNMTLKPKPGQIHTVQGKGNVIKHRETIYQLVHLGQFFEVPADAQTALDGVVVMVEANGQAFGLIVDEILHKQEVVVKNLGGSTHTQGVSGGAILGDGTISLILDPVGLSASQTRLRV